MLRSGPIESSPAWPSSSDSDGISQTPSRSSAVACFVRSVRRDAQSRPSAPRAESRRLRRPRRYRLDRRFAPSSSSGATSSIPMSAAGSRGLETRCTSRLGPGRFVANSCSSRAKSTIRPSSLSPSAICVRSACSAGSGSIRFAPIRDSSLASHQGRVEHTDRLPVPQRWRPGRVHDRLRSRTIFSARPPRRRLDIARPPTGRPWRSGSVDRACLPGASDSPRNTRIVPTDGCPPCSWSIRSSRSRPPSRTRFRSKTTTSGSSASSMGLGSRKTRSLAATPSCEPRRRGRSAHRAEDSSGWVSRGRCDGTTSYQKDHQGHFPGQ